MNIDELNQFAGKALSDVGCESKYIGFFFLKEALAQVLYNGASNEYVGKALYNDIAERFYTLPDKVEQSIGVFINCSWEQLERLDIFAAKPSSEEFIKGYAVYLSSAAISLSIKAWA